MRLTLTHHKENIGKISQQFGSKIASIMTGISSTQCSYYHQKYLDSTWHSSTWGGKRYRKFTEEQSYLLKYLLIKMLEEGTQCKTSDFVRDLRYFDFFVNEKFVQRIFKNDFGLTWKKPTTMNIRKFMEDNMKYYVRFLAEIR
jgi:transposase